MSEKGTSNNLFNVREDFDDCGGINEVTAIQSILVIPTGNIEGLDGGFEEGPDETCKMVMERHERSCRETYGKQQRF